MSGRWFDSSRQIFWDNNQQDLTIPGVLETSTANISSIVGDTLTISSISSLVANIDTLTTSSIVINNINNSSAQISSLVSANISSLLAQVGALTTSSIVSNNLSSLIGQISSLITLNISTVQETVNALTASSIVSNNVSSFTSQVSSLTALNMSSLRAQVGGLTTSSIVSNNLSSLIGQISSLITLNISTVQETVNALTASSIVSNNVSSFTSQVSSLITLNFSTVQGTVNRLTTSSIVSNNISSLTSQSGALTTSSIVTNSLFTNGAVTLSNLRENNILMIASTQQILTSNSATGVYSYYHSAESGSNIANRIRIGSYSSGGGQALTLNEAGGNVGIGDGMFNPVYTLDVNGTAKLSTLQVHSLNASAVQVAALETSSITANSITPIRFYSWQTTTTDDFFTTGLTSAFNQQGSNFTLECYFYPTLNLSFHNVLSLNNAVATPGNEFRIYYSGPTGFGIGYPAGPTTDGSLTGAFAASNAWYHLALVRVGTNIRLYLNGTSWASATMYNFTTSANRRLQIFNNAYNDPRAQGYINSVRCIIGQALYTGAFTPPTQQLTTTSVGTSGANVAASITGTVAFLGAVANSFTDQGPNTMPITVTGSPTLSLSTPTTFVSNLTFSGFTTSSIGINCNAPQYLLDVNGTVNLNDNLSFAGSPIPDLGANYSALGLLGGNSHGYLYGAYNSLGDGIHLSYNHINCNLGTSANGDIRSYIPNVGGRTSQLDIGYGEIGFAVGNSNAVPTKKMFLNSNGLSIINPAPNFSWRTTSTNNAIFTGTVANFNVGSGNFTMECYFNPSATPSTYGTIMCIGTTATQGHEFRISQRIDTNGFGFIFPTGATTDGNVSLSAANVLQSNVWYHLALVRSTNFAYLYSNGTAILSTNAVSHTYIESKRLFLFSNPYPDLTGQGYINSARFVLGQALYTGNFAPPTQQLTTTAVGTSGPNVAASLIGTVAFLGGVVSTLTDSGPSGLALTVGGSPTSPTSLVFSPGTFIPGTVVNPSTLFTCLGSNIGINCNTPAYRLDVNGTTRIFNDGEGLRLQGAQTSNPLYITFQKPLGPGYVGWFGDGLQGFTFSSIFGMQTPASTSIAFFPGASAGASPPLFLGSNSRVGILTNTPTTTLDVNGTTRLNGAVTMPSLPENNALITSGAQQVLLSNTGSTYIYMNATASNIRMGSYDASLGARPFTLNELGGNVGVGTTNPLLPLHVGRTVSYTLPAGWQMYYTPSPAGGTGFLGAGLTEGVSIYALGDIWSANRFVVSSDERIKQDITPLSLDSTIQLLQKITPVSYTYKDIMKSKQVHVGFIAQAVEDICPNAISHSSEYIPNINTIVSTITTNSTITTYLEIDSTFLNSSIQFYTPDHTKIQGKIVSISSNSFDTSMDTILPNYSTLLCKGVSVNDFRVLDKEYIFTLNVAATKKLMELVEQQGSTIKSIQEQLSTLQRI